MAKRKLNAKQKAGLKKGQDLMKKAAAYRKKSGKKMTMAQALKKVSKK